MASGNARPASVCQRHLPEDCGEENPARGDLQICRIERTVRLYHAPLRLSSETADRWCRSNPAMQICGCRVRRAAWDCSTYAPLPHERRCPCRRARQSTGRGVDSGGRCHWSGEVHLARAGDSRGVRVGGPRPRTCPSTAQTSPRRTSRDRSQCCRPRPCTGGARPHCLAELRRPRAARL